MDRRRFFREGLRELLRPMAKAVEPIHRVATELGNLEPDAAGTAAAASDDAGRAVVVTTRPPCRRPIRPRVPTPTGCARPARCRSSSSWTRAAGAAKCVDVCPVAVHQDRPATARGRTARRTSSRTLMPVRPVHRPGVHAPLPDRRARCPSPLSRHRHGHGRAGTSSSACARTARRARCASTTAPSARPPWSSSTTASSSTKTAAPAAASARTTARPTPRASPSPRAVRDARHTV